MSGVLPGWLRNEEDGLVSYSVPECERFLAWVADRGFLLHGSPVAIRSFLEPRASSNGGVRGDRESIYLTDIAPQAIFCALVVQMPNEKRVVDIVRRLENGDSTYERIRLRVGSERQVRPHGYVYLVAREHAGGRDRDDYLCFHRILPSLVVRVSRDDLRYDIELEAHGN